jgi:hypothetical protein
MEETAGKKEKIQEKTKYFFLALMYSPENEWEARQGLGRFKRELSQ